MEQETRNADLVPEPSSEGVGGDDSVLSLERIAAERDKLERERGELADRLARLAAEFDNFRKRSERERSEYLEFAAMDAVKSLLPVLDDFERALKVETADAEYARGMALIYQRMFDALKKLGLEPIDCEGQPFDPNLHYAIDRLESDDIDVDTVAAEYQRGYNFKGRLLRPSMVRVAVKG